MPKVKFTDLPEVFAIANLLVALCSSAAVCVRKITKSKINLNFSSVTFDSEDDECLAGCLSGSNLAT